MNSNKIIVLLLIFIPSICLYAIDNPHFYRANFFWGEPRFEEPLLSTFEVTFGGGSTKKSRNKNGKKTNLLNIYGLQNIQGLAQGVPNLDSTDPLDAILIDLVTLPERDNFGKIRFKGEFDVEELVLNGFQNITNGFFIQAYLPIRALHIYDIHFIDESPTDNIFPNRNTPQWLNFLSNSNAIFERFNRSINNVSEWGIGDLSILVGWARNYQETCYIDYIDVDAKVGILFPTAKKASLDNPFSLPLGYNGFYGLPFKFDCSIGYWEWLTAGFHIGALFLFDREKLLALKTAPDQNGFIFLAQGEAHVDPGTYWELSTYIKADHILKGLSLLVGYCYTQKDADCVRPYNSAVFNLLIVNDDERFKLWNMHVIHWLIEYDVSKKPTDLKPRLGIVSNLLVGGKRVFNTSIIGPFLGLDISWCF